jgi:hypothetical protein
VINHSRDQSGSSSSILPMLPRHWQASPGTEYVGAETVRVRRLDDLFDQLWRAGERVYLKIDVQGYEKQVLDGAARTLQRVAGVQCEISLVPLYAGGPLLPEMLEYMNARGFRLHSIEVAMIDPASSQLLQIDGIFYRDE